MSRNLDRRSRDGHNREEQMRDDPIRDALRATTEQPSPYFNQKVLSRLESAKGHRTAVLRPALAAAALAVLVLVAVGGLQTLTSREPTVDKEAQRQLLLDEYQALRLELEELRSMASDAGPSLYLGGDEAFDVMYDLSAYAAADVHDNIQPASLRND
jgi:hypothetical protein